MENQTPLRLLWITDLSETGYTNASRTLIKYLYDNEEAKKKFAYLESIMNGERFKEPILPFSKRGVLYPKVFSEEEYATTRN